MRCRRHGKLLFATEQEARDFLDRAARTVFANEPPRRPVRAYYAPQCGFWHVTSLRKGTGKRVRDGRKSRQW